MRELLSELKLVFVITAVVGIVWVTAVSSGREPSAYYPPDEQYVRLREEAKAAEQKAMEADETVVRLELNP